MLWSDTDGVTDVVGPLATDCMSPPEPTTPIALTEPTTETLGGAITAACA